MFYNSMNLDTKYGGGHFGSRFPTCCDPFEISHPFLFFSHPVFQRRFVESAIHYQWQNVQLQQLSLLSHPPILYLRPCHSLLLSHRLNSINLRLTNLYSRPLLWKVRTGLRKDRLKALERTHYFTNWTPPDVSCGAPEPIHRKQFVLCKILITPLSYMTLCEEGTFRKGDGRDHLRDGYYQWYRPPYKKRSTTLTPESSCKLLWTFEDEYEMISWSYSSYLLCRSGTNASHLMWGWNQWSDLILIQLDIG